MGFHQSQQHVKDTIVQSEEASDWLITQKCKKETSSGRKIYEFELRLPYFMNLECDGDF